MPALLDLLLPPRCLACGAPTSTAQGVDVALCGGCTAELEPDGEGHELAEGVIAVAPYAYSDPLAIAIKRVKTDAMRAGARALASLLAPSLPPRSARTWVPAPPRRRRRRGLDLAEALAGPGADRLLRSTRDRPDQADLGAAGRRRAVRGAYAATGTPPPGLVVVDDVRTTGATLLAAATALQHAGARRVVAISLAAAPGPPSAARRPVGPAPPGPASAAASGRWPRPPPA